MPENLKNKSVLIYDQRMWVSLAERLARDFGKVMYYSSWEDAFPQLKYNLIGEGLNNVERVDDFDDCIDDADLIIFPDVLNSGKQVYLEGLGKKVWGSRTGDRMELNRVWMMKLLEKLGLPVIPYELITGMDDLRKYLKENKDTWVKCSKYRGSFETFKSVNYDYISLELDTIEHELGAWKTEQEFICEKDTPGCVEVGYDGFCVNGQYPTINPIGLEIKDLGYVCKMKPYSELPSQITDFNNKIAPYMKKWGYKNHFSTEVRIDENGTGYMTDACTRLGSPPGELMQEMFTNFSDIIWQGANGVCIDPIPQDKYGVELIINCDWAKKNTLAVQIPEKFKDNIKLKSYMKLDETYYVIPCEVGLAEIGAVVATGDTLEDACEKVEEISDSIRASSIKIPMDSLKKAQEEIDKLKSFGYDIFS
jgi:hypothetical protein